MEKLQRGLKQQRKDKVCKVVVQQEFYLLMLYSIKSMEMDKSQWLIIKISIHILMQISRALIPIKRLSNIFQGHKMIKRNY
jgi:hypothetical protein